MDLRQLASNGLPKTDGEGLLSYPLGDGRVTT